MNSALQVHIAYNAGMQSSGLCFSSFNVDYLNLDYKGKRSMSVLLQKVCTSNLCWTCSILPILRLWPSCSTSEVLREKNCNIERTERRDVINVLKGLSAILKLFITNKTHVDLLPLHQYSKCHQTSISIILCFPRREMPSCSCSSIFKNLSLSLSSFQTLLRGLDKVKHSNSKARSISQDGIRLSAKRRRMIQNIDRVSRLKLSLI